MNGGWQNESTVGSGWDQWLGQFTPRLLLFARQQSRCEADAHELVQDAVVEAWRQQVDGVPPAPGLVFGLIRRRAIDRARQNHRRQNRETRSQESAAQDWFAPEIEDRERARLLQEALNQLPEIQRSVVTLKVWGGLTFAEIASALEIPANTAASRYRYALAELRKLTKEIFV
ncbi:MAG: sigma-70 family RNA polymerase sigma factor [Verrucomicrobiota bacterium]